MISVVLDKEILTQFKGKIGEGIDVVLGDRLLLRETDGRPFWVDRYGLAVFDLGPKGLFQYDDEFTEWLKEHRPEVFL